MEDNLAAVDERQLQDPEDGGSHLDSQLMVVAEDETEPKAIAEPTEIRPASANGANELPENDARQTETSLRGPTGPRTLRGKTKTRLNAIKHGIFAVGIIPSRESEGDYLEIVDGLSASIPPEGILEELLVEKLAMLTWRYRRLLQAEAAEVVNQTKNSQDAYIQHKMDAVDAAKGKIGLISVALEGHNDMALEAAIARLKAIRERVTAQGLDWERDRKELTNVYGDNPKPGEWPTVGVKVTRQGRTYEILEPERLVVYLYSYFTRSVEDKPIANLPPDPAEFIRKMITEDIDRFEPMLRDWRQEGDDRNELEEARWLVPTKEASDRLQRYEGSLERSFDRALSQLDRLQRMRLGQPVLPAIKLDISH